MSPRISVIVCAHDYGRYLGAALDSVLAQDWPADRLQVVVVDDGSTDDTPRVMASYGDRIHPIRRPNGGIKAATNDGLAVADGDYITFLDADDRWPAGRLRPLADALDAAPDAVLAYGDMAVIDPRGRTVHPSFRAASGLVPGEGDVLGRLLACNFVSAGAMMVRAAHRDAFFPIPAWGGHQDWWIAYRLAAVGPVVSVPDVVCHYRLHGANANLTDDAAARLRLFRTELPFRRRTLAEADWRRIRPGELRAALAFHDEMTAAVAAADGVAPHADARAFTTAMEAASAALDDGDLERTHALLIGAAAHDPASRECRGLLGELAPLVDAASGT